MEHSTKLLLYIIITHVLVSSLQPRQAKARLDSQEDFAICLVVLAGNLLL